MDTYLAIVSKRDTRRYADTPIPDDVVERILDAGRVTGSASNRQPWRFLIVEDAERREKLADAVYEPTNIRGAQLVIAIVGTRPLDLGRCAQNMMLAAWNDGVASCPNGIADKDAAQGSARPRGAAGQRAQLRLPGEATGRGDAIRRGVERAGEPEAARRDGRAALGTADSHPDGAVTDRHARRQMGNVDRRQLTRLRIDPPQPSVTRYGRPYGALARCDEPDTAVDRAGRESDQPRSGSTHGMQPGNLWYMPVACPDGVAGHHERGGIDQARSDCLHG